MWDFFSMKSTKGVVAWNNKMRSYPPYPYNLLLSTTTLENLRLKYSESNTKIY